MCGTCGCGDTDLVPVEIQESLLAANDHAAAHNREHFAAADLTTINLMGSPGSGKTALLEATAVELGGRLRLAAVSGDLATARDADRLEAAGIPARSITTGSACHLDAELVHRTLHGWSHEGWSIDETDLLFVENVGNLVCPAIYDLGQQANVVALSVTEGEDKPLKYPVMFHHADLVLITKIDLAPHLPGFDFGALEAALAEVMPEPRAIRTSAVSGEGIDRWIDWLESRRGPQRRTTAAVEVARLGR
ncbi:MAG: hydrogenase nickel incorporation protein HypB [Thermoanaerobaculia bacterium]|nr:hydrogenase nickel incorporation protein HypB [Thermoanaerobaculia bacterium]